MNYKAIFYFYLFGFVLCAILNIVSIFILWLLSSKQESKNYRKIGLYRNPFDNLYYRDKEGFFYIMFGVGLYSLLSWIGVLTNLYAMLKIPFAFYSASRNKREKIRDLDYLICNHSLDREQISLIILKKKQIIHSLKVDTEYLEGYLDELRDLKLEFSEERYWTVAKDLFDEAQSAKVS